MNERWEREALLLGEDAIKRLEKSHVALFGVGGVGGYAAEALARSGVGAITLVDGDVINLSNVNRQLCALESTLGRPKVKVTAARLTDINPDLKLTLRQEFVTPDSLCDYDFSEYDYVIDAIDTVSAKLAIIEASLGAGTPVISCMGAGNKCDPTAFRVIDLAKTTTCPLARVMRRELKKRGVTHLPVVWSPEEAKTPKIRKTDPESGKPVSGSLAFVPSVAGLIAASEAVKTLCGFCENEKKETQDE